MAPKTESETRAPIFGTLVLESGAGPFYSFFCHGRESYGVRRIPGQSLSSVRLLDLKTPLALLAPFSDGLH